MPYLCFDDGAAANCNGAQSPFAGTDFSAGYFHLETVEDGAINTPGVNVNSGVSIAAAGAFNTDSVDEDDGMIDGDGRDGRSMFNQAVDGFEFTFSASVLGDLPTHVGLVWTDGSPFSEVTFEAFGAGGQSLGVLVQSGFSDATTFGTTDEDRFFGLIDGDGISRITMFHSAFSGGGTGIEADHLQYGNLGGAMPIPIPASLILLGTALLSLLGVAKFQRP